MAMDISKIITVSSQCPSCGEDSNAKRASLEKCADKLCFEEITGQETTETRLCLDCLNLQAQSVN